MNLCFDFATYIAFESFVACNLFKSNIFFPRTFEAIETIGTLVIMLGKCRKRAVVGEWTRSFLHKNETEKSQACVRTRFRPWNPKKKNNAARCVSKCTNERFDAWKDYLWHCDNKCVCAAPWRRLASQCTQITRLHQDYLDYHDYIIIRAVERAPAPESMTSSA